MVAVALMVAPDMANAEVMINQINVSNLTICSIQYGDYLYISDSTDGIYLYKTDLQGNVIGSVIVGNYIREMVICGHYIYGCNHGSNQVLKYDIETDTAELIPIAPYTVTTWAVYNFDETLYFTDYSEGDVIVCDSEGIYIETIYCEGSGLSSLAFDGEDIWYFENIFGKFFKLSSPTTEEFNLLGEGSMSSFTFKDGYFYITYAETDKINKVNREGSIIDTYHIGEVGTTGYYIVSGYENVYFSCSGENPNFYGIITPDNVLSTYPTSFPTFYISNNSGNYVISAFFELYLINDPEPLPPEEKPTSTPSLWALLLANLPMITFAAVIMALVAIPLYYGRKHTKAPRKGRSRR